MRYEYRADPVPHLYLPEIAPPELRAELRFPELEPREGGRIGRDLYAGEPGYDAVMADPAWAALRCELTSASFVREVLTAFADDLVREGALLDPTRFRMRPYQESRRETQAPKLRTGEPVESLFCRFDFQAADASYRKEAHVDHARRVVGGVLVFSDADREGLSGGEFAFFGDDRFANDRVCHAPRVLLTYPIRDNTGVLFLNSNRAFHGPLPIGAATGLRRWVYYSISSHRDVWRPKPLLRLRPNELWNRTRHALFEHG